MPTALPYYPPAAFYFAVTILTPGSGPWETAMDAAFQEVSGLERELEYEEVREGGENRFSHRLPKRGRHPNLVLKRGLVSVKSGLADWTEQTLASTFTEPVQPRTLVVKLLNRFGKPLVAWTFSNAYPVKWITAPLNSTESAIAVETIELTYGAVKREIVGNQEGLSA